LRGSGVLKIIKFIIPMVAVILGVLSLTTEYNFSAYMFVCISIIDAIYAVEFYKQNKKIFAIIMLFISVVIFIIAVMFFLQNGN